VSRVNAVIHQIRTTEPPRIHQMARAVDKLWTMPGQPPIANISTLGSDDAVALERSSE
jgi:hypothetical protein